MTDAVSPTPRRSVVVPTHDTRALTLACIESLHSVGADHGEVIVVDDASQDGTAEALQERYPAVRVLRNTEAKGFSRSANRGLAVASGEFLVLLNSDTQVAAGSWEALDSAFRDRPRLGVVGGALRFPDGALQWSGGRFPGLVWLFLLATGLPPLLGRMPGARMVRPVSGGWGGPVDWVTGAAMAFRREVWEEVGGFDEEFQLYGQDLDFCMRAKQAGWDAAVVPGFRVVHHQGATIGRRRASAGRQSPGPLWRDLVRWGLKHRGAGWARRGAGAIALGARFRLAGRWLAGLRLVGRARERWRRDSLTYRSALAGLHEAVRTLEGSPIVRESPAANE